MTAIVIGIMGNDQLFDGKLKKYTSKKILLELNENAHPIHCKPFPVPKTQVVVFRRIANDCVTKMYLNRR